MKIAILGSAPSSVRLAPFNNAAHQAWVQGKIESLARAHAQISGEWDIWGCSPGCWAVVPRATRWFEVHRWEPGQYWFGPEYLEFLRNFQGIVYTGGAVPEIPNHVVYPIDEMEAKFSSYFMTSSVALMLATAIDTIEKIRETRKAFKAWESGTSTHDAPPAMPDGVSASELDQTDHDDVIGIWGVDMAAAEEYGYQRPGCQFFILEAGRRGIGVYLPPESDLMRPMPVYGISEWDHNYIRLTARARELSQRSATAQAQLKEAETNLAGLAGEMGALNAFVQTWTSPYGMQHGVVNRQDPGTGLGSGITHVDMRPVQRMIYGGAPGGGKTAAQEQSAVMAAMTAKDPSENPVVIAPPNQHITTLGQERQLLRNARRRQRWAERKAEAAGRAQRLASKRRR